jgi:thiol:disulfide interchange protein DsbD
MSSIFRALPAEGPSLSEAPAPAIAAPVAAFAPVPAAPAAEARALAPGAAPAEGGVLSFLLLAFLAGLGALATPCVFPAIPLTVSFFSKFTNESFGRGARLAAFYALSMMAFLTGAGVLISVLVGATGVTF